MSTSLLGAIAGTLGVILGFGYFSQVAKIVRRRSAADISYVTFGLIVITTAVWDAYGIATANLPIIAANSVGLLGASLVLAVAIYFNHRR